MKKPKTQEERQQVEVKGLTFADINECYYLAIMDSSSDQDASEEAIKKYEKTGEIDTNFVFKLNWEKIDPIAIRQNLDCWIERKMGIFPNIKLLKCLKKDL